MVDVDPEIFNNPTLGAAANGVFLDVMEAQQAENRAAAIEGREPELVHREGRYPGYMPENPSSYHSDVTIGNTFQDGSPVTAPQGGPVKPEASGIPAAQKPSQRPSAPSVVPPQRTRQSGWGRKGDE